MKRLKILYVCRTHSKAIQTFREVSEEIVGPWVTRQISVLTIDTPYDSIEFVSSYNLKNSLYGRDLDIIYFDSVDRDVISENYPEICYRLYCNDGFFEEI